MRNLFAYGTLMCEDIMQQVAGCLPAPVSATLAGYRRRAVRDEQYPGVVACPESCVQGVLYRRVPGFAWPRLDGFEGDMYLRRRVRVALADGAVLPAETYVVRPRFVARLAPDEWSLAEFLRSGKASFCSHYKGYRRLK